MKLAALSLLVISLVACDRAKPPEPAVTAPHPKDVTSGPVHVPVVPAPTPPPSPPPRLEDLDLRGVDVRDVRAWKAKADRWDALQRLDRAYTETLHREGLVPATRHIPAGEGP